MSSNDRYTHGHHESVLRSHRWRTAENSAAYLLAHLREDQALLDVGCGPGTISADFARRLSRGRVLAIDNAATIIEQATIDADFADLTNLTFEVRDVYATGLADDSFDVVHAHQVLQHVTDPVAALREMRRVVKPDGLVAVRDTDFGAFTWYPEDERLSRWLAIYHEMTRRNGAQADAGRRLKAWAHEAGFRELDVSSSNWTFEQPEERAWWGGLWADRVVESRFAEQALEYELATRDDLAAFSQAFREWSREPEGVFFVVHGEVIARR
ncbi:MAG: methyltransferase domain-containing protein [Acidobacteriota bacterium]|nr:methyltransferase domain-containing protein [Acidobacteriota bacterium]